MTAQTILPANTLSSGYDVANSLRLNSADSPYMHKVKDSNDEINTFTLSAWVKRSKLGATQRVISHMTTSFANFFYFRFESTDQLTFASENTGNHNAQYKTNRLFRDVSAWYHIVARINTTASGGSRIRIYVNGVQETSFATSTEPDQNSTFSMGTTSDPIVVGGLYGVGYGISSGNSSEHYGGYIAELVVCEGQSLAPTSFGEFDSDSGIWKPKDVSGLTFGNNGFYLDFEDSSNLGNDVNGGTDLTEVNIAATDQSTDTCTNNFATLNPLFGGHSQYATFTEGNLKVTGNNNSNAGCNLNSTLAPSSGKWYMEFKAIDIQGASYPGVGVIMEDDVFVSLGQVGGNPNSVSYRAGGTILSDGGVTATENAYTDNAIVSVALDLDNGAVYFANDDDYQANGDPTSGSSRTGSLYNFTASEKSYFFAITAYQATSIVSANFGSPDYAISSGNADANGHGNFEYAVPSGYFALCTKNLAEFG